MPIFNVATHRLLEALSADLPQGILLSGQQGLGTFRAARFVGELTKINPIIGIAPDEKGTLTISAVRELYMMSRTKSEPKIFIIDDADTMSREAQNAFLKLLEEPNDSTHFILTSHAPEKLLPTILSRVQTITLKPISRVQTEQLLDELGVTDSNERAQLIFVAAGLPASLSRYALDKPSFVKRAASIRDARSFIQGVLTERLLLGTQYSGDRALALEWLGDIVRLLERNLEQAADPRLLTLLDHILEASDRIVENGNVRLQLTHAVMSS